MNNDVQLQVFIEKSMQLKITHINTRSMISTYDGLLLTLKQYYAEGSNTNKKETANKKKTENAIKKENANEKKNANKKEKANRKGKRK